MKDKEVREEILRLTQQEDVWGLYKLGRKLSDRNRLEFSETAFRNMVELARLGLSDAEDKAIHLLGHGLFHLSNVHGKLSKWDESLAESDEGLRIFRRLARKDSATYDEFVALTLNNMGTVLRDANKLEKARDTLREALTIRRDLARNRKDYFRRYLASTLTNLGNVHGDLGEFEEALTCYSDAYELYLQLARENPEVFNKLLATILNNLGEIHTKLGSLERAQDSYLEARKHLDHLPERDEHLFGAILNNLGDVRQKCFELERAEESYVEACASYRRLVQQRPQVFTRYLAKCLSNLGNAQRNLGKLDEAQKTYLEAEKIYRKLVQENHDVFLPEFAMVLNNLGNLQRDLNALEVAKQNTLESLQIRRDLSRKLPAVYDQDVATSLNNLGNVYSDLGALEEARTSYSEALAIRRRLAEKLPKVFKRDVATTLSNLGNVLSNSGSLEEARLSYDQALEIRRDLARSRASTFTHYVATTLNNLSAVLFKLGQLKEAYETCAEALTLRRSLARRLPEAFNQAVATSLNNLGDIHRALGAIDEAQANYVEATRIYDQQAERHPEALVVKRRRSHVNLAEVLRDRVFQKGRPDFQSARMHLKQACQCADQFRSMFLAETERQRISKESHQIFELHVSNSMDLWDEVNLETIPDMTILEEAVWAVEASRSRQLLDRLQGQEFQPTATPINLEEQYRKICKKIDVTYTSIEPRRTLVEIPHANTRGIAFGDNSVDFAIPITRPWKQLEKLEGARTKILNQILSYDPAYRPDGITARTSKDIQRLIPNDRPTAFVEFAFGRDASFAFIITSDTIVPLRLHGVTTQAGFELSQEWFLHYNRLKDNRQSDQGWRGFSQFIAKWNQVMQEILARVSQLALIPLLKALPPGIKRLVIAPHQALHVFPLHACPIEYSGNLLIDRFEISYTPSFSILHHCARADACSIASSSSADFLLADNPTGDLRFSEVEGMALSNRFRSSGTMCHLPYGNVRKDGLRSGVLDCRCFHYSGHATFNGRDPLDSALILSDESLTLREIFARLRLRRNDLTVLNGCESGLLLPDDLDDYHNFTTGFLFAGSRSVVSTLWSIPDLPSALLMDRFYSHWLDGEPVASALNQAQNWLRRLKVGTTFEPAVEELISNVADEEFVRVCDQHASLYGESFGETPFELPAHWAAFTSNGLCFPKVKIS